MCVVFHPSFYKVENFGYNVVFNKTWLGGLKKRETGYINKAYFLFPKVIFLSVEFNST